jgi:hypothetical protein
MVVLQSVHNCPRTSIAINLYYTCIYAYTATLEAYRKKISGRGREAVRSKEEAY